MKNILVSAVVLILVPIVGLAKIDKPENKKPAKENNLVCYKNLNEVPKASNIHSFVESIGGEDSVSGTWKGSGFTVMLFVDKERIQGALGDNDFGTIEVCETYQPTKLILKRLSKDGVTIDSIRTIELVEAGVFKVRSGFLSVNFTRMPSASKSPGQSFANANLSFRNPASARSGRGLN